MPRTSDMTERAWLAASWTGRAFLAAIVLKVIVVAALWTTGGSSTLELVDRTVNFALIVLAVLAVGRWTAAPRTNLLWWVRRKLIVSYVLIGAVPILLLVAFSGLGLLLVMFDVSSYLVQNRLTGISDQANGLARTTMIELDRTPFDGRPDVLARRQAVLETRYPGIVMTMVSTTGSPRCGVPAARELPFPPLGTLPRWVNCRGFAGLLLYQGSHAGGVHFHLVARAVALPNRPNPDYALVVDLPVDEATTDDSFRDMGIQLGDLTLVVGDNGASPLLDEHDNDNGRVAGSQRSFLNTATFLNYTDWQRGLTGRAALSMNVQVGALYRWLGGNQGRTAGVNFSRVLLVMLIGIGALLFVIEVVALGNGLALARSITDAVDDLFHGTERVRIGDYSQPIPQHSDDQLGQLARSFNDMTRSVQLALEDRAEKQRLEEELRIARDIQMSLLPQGPLKAPGLSLAALCAPAREVGGDYYDYLPLSDGRLGLLIADVSGKGTSAALYMAELKGLMLSLSRIHTSPRALLIEANRIVSLHLDNRSFITMTYAVLDTVARTITCARAGHTPFMHIPARGEGAGRAAVLAPDGMVLGLNLDNGERFERLLGEITMPLETGDLFFFFTDGISEAMDVAGECFGETRLSAFLEGHTGDAPEAIRDDLLREVSDFAAGQPQHDDITMMILKIE